MTTIITRTMYWRGGGREGGGERERISYMYRVWCVPDANEHMYTVHVQHSCPRVQCATKQFYIWTCMCMEVSISIPLLSCYFLQPFTSSSSTRPLLLACFPYPSTLPPTFPPTLPPSLPPLTTPRRTDHRAAAQRQWQPQMTDPETLATPPKLS